MEGIEEHQSKKAPNKPVAIWLVMEVENPRTSVEDSCNTCKRCGSLQADLISEIVVKNNLLRCTFFPAACTGNRSVPVAALHNWLPETKS